MGWMGDACGIKSKDGMRQKHSYRIFVKNY